MRITKAFAAKALLVILILISIFHVLVLLQIIPHTVVWAGKFNSYREVLPFEIVSLTMNLSFIALVYHRAKRPGTKIGRIGMWFMVVLFGLNTIGNLFAETAVERLTATPLTLIIALLSLRLALRDTPAKTTR